MTWKPALAVTAVMTAVLAAAFLAADATPKLPPPFATPSVNNGPRVVEKPSDAELKLPAGFRVEIFAEGFEKPRYMLQGLAGEILVSDANAENKGAVYALKGKERKKLIDKLDRPYGLALWKDYLYVGEPTSVKRYKYDAKALTAGAGQEIASLAKFTTSHWTRSLLFDSKGEKLYVGIGSGSNVDTGEDPMRAAINRFNPDGSGHEIYAAGTRNPIGLHWYPGTNILWVGVQ